MGSGFAATQQRGGTQAQQGQRPRLGGGHPPAIATVLADALDVRGGEEGAIASMIGGLLMTGGWKLFGNPGIDPVLPGFLCSGILLVAVSLMTSPPPEEAIEPYFN